MTYIDDDGQSPFDTTSVDPAHLTSLIALSEVRRWETDHHGLRHPSSVQVLTAWRALYGNHRGREGVLRAERLSPLTTRAATDSRGQGRAEHGLRTGAELCNYSNGIIPIAKAGVGLAPMVQEAGQEVDPFVGKRLCWLCGSVDEAHWPALPLEESSDDDACLAEAGSPRDGEDSGGNGRDMGGGGAGGGRKGGGLGNGVSLGGSGLDSDAGLRCRQVLDLSDAGDDAFLPHKRHHQDDNEKLGSSRRLEGTSKKRRSSGSCGKGVVGASVSGYAEDEGEGDVDNDIPHVVKKKQTKKITSKGSSATGGDKRGTPSPSDVIRQLQKQVTVLETDLSAARELVRSKEKECAILVRKFDRRFAKEMETRRSWNAEKRVLEARILALEGHSALMESRAVAAESHNQMIRDRIAPLHHLLEALERGSLSGIMAPEPPPPQSQYPQYVQQQQTPWVGPLAGASGGYVAEVGSGHDKDPSGRAFCVVCQDHTADTLVLPCGHLCVCNYHGVTMQAQGRLTKCPLCSRPSTGICRAVGL